MAQRLDFRSADFAADFDALLSGKREQDSDVHDAVAKIIADVRANGDPAVLALTAQFDNLKAETMAELAVGQDEMAAALDGLLPELRDALDLAADRIRKFHERQLPQDFTYEDEVGVKLGMRFGPVDAAGLYVPGGKAAYPSSV
ncbi:MAG: histidinol dehydrogenase, partial [Candidatus Puniceispirillaceae bacterium]